MDRAGDQALLVLLALTHVEHDRPRLDGEPLRGLLSRLLPDLLLHRCEVIAGRNHQLHLPFPLRACTCTKKSTNRMDPNFSPDVPNVESPVRIPSGRRRLILVAAVAVAAGAIAAAVVLATRGGGGGSGGSPQAVTGKPLTGTPPLFLDLPGPAVTGGNAAVYAAAQRRLPAGDVRLAVARALIAYSPATRAQTIATLERLPQRNPAVVFALGMAQLWAGQPGVAAVTLERVKRARPVRLLRHERRRPAAPGARGAGVSAVLSAGLGARVAARAAGGGRGAARRARGRGSRSRRVSSAPIAWPPCAMPAAPPT